MHTIPAAAPRTSTRLSSRTAGEAGSPHVRTCRNTIASPSATALVGPPCAPPPRGSQQLTPLTKAQAKYSPTCQG